MQLAVGVHGLDLADDDVALLEELAHRERVLVRPHALRVVW